MVEKEKFVLIQAMKDEGFSEENIKKVLQGVQEEEDGKLLSPEEVYASLFVGKKNIYV